MKVVRIPTTRLHLTYRNHLSPCDGLCALVGHRRWHLNYSERAVEHRSDALLDVPTAPHVLARLLIYHGLQPCVGGKQAVAQSHHPWCMLAQDHLELRQAALHRMEECEGYEISHRGRLSAEVEPILCREPILRPELLEDLKPSDEATLVGIYEGKPRYFVPHLCAVAPRHLRKKIVRVLHHLERNRLLGEACREQTKFGGHVVDDHRKLR
mmetsp:Transcript_14156/g.36678  ORF Transcript_14156/g.36678 Transcript_14156/m.36678 type:complete len:211 (+) Transcript_14156:288-920(+)